MFYALLSNVFLYSILSVLQFSLLFYLLLVPPSLQVVDTVCSLFREFFNSSEMHLFSSTMPNL